METDIKEPVNPFPEFIEDEASGAKVKNQRWVDWERCHEEHMEYCKKVVMTLFAQV